MTPLSQQLEDKKKGCGKKFEYTNDYSPHYINCGNRFANTDKILCQTCKAEIAILEQAIAEIKKLEFTIHEKDLIYQTTKQTLTSTIEMLSKYNDELKAEMQKQRQKILERIYFILKDIKCNSHQFISETEECFDREWEEMLEKLNQPKTEKENSKQ